MSQPRAGLAPTIWEAGVEHLGMAGDKPPLGARISDDQELADAPWPPIVLPGQQRWHNSELARHGGMQILDVCDAALDFHQHQAEVPRMPADEVDRPAIPEMIEREFNEDLPAVTPEDRRDGVRERRVLLVKNPRQLTSAPAWVDHHTNLERSSDGAQAGDREALELA